MSETDLNIDEEINRAWDTRLINLKLAFNLGLSLKEKSEQINSEKGLAGANKVLGYCYWRFSDYTTSLKHSLLALDTYKFLGDKRGEADALNSIGAVYMFQGKNKKRLQCNLDCLAIREEIGDLEAVSGSQNNIGETYLELSDFENATIWFEKCLNNPDSGETNIAWVNFNLGKTKILQGDKIGAILFFEKALLTCLSINYEILISETYLELGNIYLSIEELEKAKDAAEKGKSSAKSIGAKENIEKSYLLLSNIYEKEGFTDEALIYYKKFHAAHADLFNEEKEQQIKDINYQYELNKISKEAEIERLKSVELKSAYEKIERQSQLIEIKNKEFVESVNYAKEIQFAVLNERKIVKASNFDSFLIYKPKDIVGGDFYWSASYHEYTYVVVADCTGHGVPGGFLTMLGIAYLNELITEVHIKAPNQILDELRIKIIKDLSGKFSSRDGMDISIVRIENKTQKIEWAGAKNPLWIIRKNATEIEVIPANRQSICYAENLTPFKNHELQLAKGDMVYLFTDGFSDQFGGPRGKKVGRKNFRNILLECKDKTILQQRETIKRTYKEWKGSLEQIDDICIIGIRI
jgi:serine phosphatase RsbU (regulator of sigma subunit)